MEIGATFNMSTVWPGMEGWPEVRDWAESNPDLFEAILAARDRATLGLPYGDLSEADEASWRRASSRSLHRLVIP